MHTSTEGKVRVGVTRYVELVRNLKLGGIAVCRRQKRGEHVASPERLPVQIAIADCEHEKTTAPPGGGLKL